ncbi:MAG TPA: hypothetical protein VHG71_00400 [Verrucomicrobiae bacterium]|nr:hypothetical protein [Verrucomicrobiae bacterium]
MKFILPFLILGLATSVLADDLQNSLSSTNQIVTAKQKLDLFENGKITLEDLTTNKENCDELADYYLLHKNEISTKSKLVIGRCYALEGAYPDAIRLTQEYVNIYSNDFRGWRVLGGSYALMNSFDKSIQAYKNAIQLGDTNSYESLALAAMQGNRMDIMGEIASQLMALKNSSLTSKQDRINLITILLFYSAKTYQKDLFIKTLEGENMKEILQDNKVKQDVISGCGLFKGADIDKIRQEMESVLPTSSTNSVSNLSN